MNSIDEVPEFNFQPVVSFTMYKDGYMTGGGVFSPSGTNQILYDALAATRGQAAGSLGNSQFYAYWPRSA